MSVLNGSTFYKDINRLKQLFTFLNVFVHWAQISK